MNIQEAARRAGSLENFRGDNEMHHGRADEIAYSLLALLCSGHDSDEIREVAEVVLEEEQAGVGWWYA